MLVVALCLVAVGLALWLPRYAAAQRVSDLYRRYAGNPHLTVAYIEDFRVNDTVAVDVTTLSALDAEGWETLRKDFNIKPIPDILQEELNNGRDIIVVRMVPKSDPTQPMDTTDLSKNNVIGISNLQHTISIFNTDNESQQDAIMNYNFRSKYK
jgi:hypothetical protein